MAASIETLICDSGLSVLDTVSSHIIVCEAEPLAYSLCSVGAANSLGYKSFGAGSVFGAPSGTGSRTVQSATVTDGTIVTTGTASWWAIIDGVGGSLHAHGSITSPQAVTAGNTFTLTQFTIVMPRTA